MIGDPAQFEAIGSRLGFRVVEETPDRLRLLWQGARFPALLCLGIALLLLFISVPILQALYIRGFVGPAASLWYFPLMNLILFAIAIFLVTQRRTIEVDQGARRLILQRRSLYRAVTLRASYDEIEKLRIGIDQVYSGFALGGSTAAERFPIPALRMVLASGDAVLLDRSSVRRLTEIGKAISERVNKPLEVDSQVQT
jgi:hypothetical protein